MKKLLACAAILALTLSTAELFAGERDFGHDARYRAATLDEARATVVKWLDKLDKAVATEAVRQRIADLWKADMADQSGPRLLQRLGDTFSLVDAKAKQIVDVTAKSHDRKDLPSLAWLAEDKDGAKLDPLFRDNLRLLIGRWLCQEKLYDESIAVLRDIKPENVIDPASLLFYRSVAYHRLLVKKEGLESIHALLEDVSDSPQRYVALAGLMEQDLKGLKDGSLDDISRRMEDVERRLGLSRAGKVVRKKEDDIIAMLDKVIDDLEEQQKKCQCSTGPGNGKGSQNPPNTPPIGAQTGPGTVNPRTARTGEWGRLPDKERQEALQQLGKDFPAHYRAAIEQYFRRIASDSKP
jgi:hypothetical protein